MMKENRKFLITTVLLVLTLVFMTGLALAEDVNDKDSDNDDMDDSWEWNIINKNGLNVTNISLFVNYTDPDNDGYTNLDEFKAKTDPYDSNDAPDKEKLKEKVSALILLGVALCIGIPGIMAAFGLYIAGVSAVGMTTEHPDRFAKGLILQALPMTQGVYGLVFAILLLMKAGFFGGGDAGVLTNVNVGWGAVMIGITIGLTSVSAIPQGLVAGASASGVGRNVDMFGKGMIYSVMPETMAVFGLLIALFILLGL
jgi:V/A-type H+-transporting ATPase subunit K